MAAKSPAAGEQLGFIGMGDMGSRLALRLLAAGYALTVYDRTHERTDPLATRGAAVAGSVRDLAARSAIVLTCLADDAAVEAVLLGPDGALAAARPGTGFIELSTVAPATSRRMHATARERGMALVDAAMSGSTPQVEVGTLIFFVGGEPEAYARCQPILAALGQQPFHMGPAGAGATMKLVVNALLGVGIQAVGEALALGEKAGLDREWLLDVLGQTAVVSPHQKRALENVRAGAYPVHFALRLMHKDFGLILREAAALFVPMPATAVAEQMTAAELARGIEEDVTATIQLMAELAGAHSAEAHEEGSAARRDPLG